MGKPGLAALLHTEDPSGFLRDFWPERFFHADGPPERLAGLIDYRFEDLLKMERGQTRAYRVVDGRTIRLRIQRGQESALYDSGFTIYFIDLRLPALDQWLRALEGDLGLVPHATRISAFASKRGDGLSAHFDGNDNFVCHARGVKRWSIAENTHVRYPNNGYVIGEKMLPENWQEAPQGYPEKMPDSAREVELRPGSVMYVPRGVWHSTETIDNESLHFNIRSALPVWREILEQTIKTSSGAAFDELRAPILDFFADEKSDPAIQEGLKTRIRAIADAICAADAPLPQEVLVESLVKSRKV